MQIAEGLHRIGSDTVSSYLVVDEGGVTIIDAGLPATGSCCTASSRGLAGPSTTCGH